MEYLLRAIQLPNISLRRAGDFCFAGLLHVKDHVIPHARNNYHPHILGDRALGLMSMVLVGVKILTIALLTAGPILPAFSSAITQGNIIVLTNQSRQDFGLNSLSENSVLDKAAQAKADDMLAKGYFAHVTPDGKTPWDFISSAGYNYLMAGENLAVNFAEAESVETAWMNSPGHKANILNKNFEQIGIGISQGEFQGHSAIFVVQMFGVPADQKIAITNQPTKVLTESVPVPTSPTALSDIKGAAVQVSPEKLIISNASTEVKDGQLQISAHVAGDPVKVLAYFGDKAVMMSPQTSGAWTAQADLQQLAAGNLTVHIKAFDIKEQTADIQLADFSNGTVSNYNVVAPVDSSSVKVSWMGKIFQPKSVAEKFYLYFIAGILSSMILAIVIKRHIQHVNLIANGSFVVILASLLLMAR